VIAMPHYLVYVFTKDNRIWNPPIVMTCDNDQKAVVQAEQLVDGNDIELWDGDRRVSRIKAKLESP
jgi:hypothetical protein